MILMAPFAFAADAKPDDAKNFAAHNVGGIEDAKNAGTISGVVYFTGKKPEMKPINDIAGNAFCSEHHKDKIPLKDTFVFGTNNGKDTLANVLVYVSKGLEGKDFDPPSKPVLLDQVGCMYSPHVVAVMVGQTLTVRNSDETLHNVMSSPRENPPFNFGQPVAEQTNDIKFEQPEMKINTKCFMHPWMSAYIHVLPHPFFAVTGDDGTFKIQGLPPGEYEIRVLHESSMAQPSPASAKITIAAGDTKTIDFTYHLKDQK
jgi:plastocyanin